MESARIVTWRYRYLNRLNELRTAGCPIIFIDETWYDTHDVVRKGWDDGTCSCCLQAPSSRGKRIMILHAGSSDGWVPECLYLSSKSISDSMADSHDEMNGNIFENWFENKLLANLPPRKCAIVLDNAAYHSRLKFRVPTTATKKDEIINFMKDNNLVIPNPVPIKAVLLQTIKEANIQKKFVIDEIAKNHGHEVLRLPPYHCTLNPIELVWARLKTSVRRNNVTPSMTNSVCSVLRQCIDGIDATLWGKCVQHTIKIERLYSMQDLENDNRQFVINVGGSDSEDED